MFSAILAVLFAIKILASHSQIYRLPKVVLTLTNIVKRNLHNNHQVYFYSQSHEISSYRESFLRFSCFLKLCVYPALFEGWKMKTFRFETENRRDILNTTLLTRITAHK